MNGLNKVASLCSEDEFCLCWQPDYWKPDEANKGFLHLCVFSHSVVSDSMMPWIAAHQAPLSMGFPR